MTLLNDTRLLEVVSSNLKKNSMIHIIYSIDSNGYP